MREKEEEERGRKEERKGEKRGEVFYLNYRRVVALRQTRARGRSCAAKLKILDRHRIFEHH